MNTRIAPLCLALLLAAGGCAPKGLPSIEIFETCYPPTPDTSTGACVWPSSCTASPIGSYSIDIARVDDLFIGVQANNQLPVNSSTDTGQVNTNDAFVDTFTVTYEVDGASIPDISGPPQIQNTVPAGGTGVVGVNLMQLDQTGHDALTAALAASSTGTLHVVAKMKLHGVLGDGTRWDTQERIYGIDTCSNCTIPLGCTSPKILAVCPQEFQEPSVATCITAG